MFITHVYTHIFSSHTTHTIECGMCEMIDYTSFPPATQVTFSHRAHHSYTRMTWKRSHRFFTKAHTCQKCLLMCVWNMCVSSISCC